MTKVFLALLNIGIKAGWLILAVLLLRLVLRKAPRWTVCLLWGVVALRLVFPFSIESVFSLIPSAQTVPMEVERMAEPVIHTGLSYVDESVNPVISRQMTPKQEESVNPMQIVVWVSAIVWIVGIILFQTYTLVSYAELRRKVRIAIPFRSYRQKPEREIAEDAAEDCFSDNDSSKSDNDSTTSHIYICEALILSQKST